MKVKNRDNQPAKPKGESQLQLSPKQLLSPLLLWIELGSATDQNKRASRQDRLRYQHANERSFLGAPTKFPPPSCWAAGATTAFACSMSK